MPVKSKSKAELMLILAVLASLEPDKSVPLKVVVVLAANAEVLTNNEAAMKSFFNIIFPDRYLLRCCLGAIMAIV
jgi:hypothetical protein